jgi:hypothetical protein
VPRALIAAILFVGVWLCYLPGNMGCSDSRWSIPTAVSLVDEHNADLDEYAPLLRANRFVFTHEIDGHRYSIYPFATPLIAAPAVIALRPIASAVRRRLPSLWAWLQRTQAARGCAPLDAEPVIALHSWTEHLIASAIVAAAVVVMFFIALRETSVRAAVIVALLFALGTSAWSTASRSLWQHGPSMLLLALALLIQLRGGRLFWVGLLLASAYVVRPTNAVPMAAAAAWTLICRRRQMPAFALGAALVLALFAWSNMRVYGAWLPPYYQPGFYAPNHFVADALAGNLVSPARGLLIFSPIFLLAVIGPLVKASSGTLTLLDLSIAGTVVLHWIAISVSNGNWWGGDSYGPRFFTDVLPYLTFLMLPVFALLESIRGPAFAGAAAGVTLLGAWSIGAHALGALSAAAMDWNLYPTSVSLEPVRVWDWRRPQFLAGIAFTPAPLPPVNLDLVACDAPPGVPGRPAIVENRGGTVALRWDPAPGPVAVYIMDVGTGPGLNDEPSREARDVFRPTVIARRVPPGTYYVRVRGRNRCGDGPSSPEVAVAVP